MGETALFWFRRDLRLYDQPAWSHLQETQHTIIPVFIWAPEEEDPWAPGAASRWWLHHSLEALDKALRKVGSRLVVRRGKDSLQILQELIAETGATAVCWNRLYEPATVPRDTHIKTALQGMGIAVKTFGNYLLHEPQTVKTQGGTHFKVFSPFWRAVQALDEPPEPVPAPKNLAAPRDWPRSESIGNLRLLPRIPWDVGMREAWKPGEEGALSLLREFLERGAGNYHDDRNRPDLPGTSRLSPHLHFGEISPRTIWHHTKQYLKASGAGKAERDSAMHFIREVGWREFSQHLLFHEPHTTNQPLRPEFAAFPWREDPEALVRWQKGQTGYPIVDAGMRELWHTGWMHNRVRMIVASFLVKDLRISWLKGAEWFWDTLVDANLGNNTMGWQWSGGCGADAAPYFRVFNPVLQGEKFDPDGAYVRRWVPELSGIESNWIHKPWQAPERVLAAAGVTLGGSYPHPMVDHATARDEALVAYGRIKKS